MIVHDAVSTLFHQQQHFIDAGQTDIEFFHCIPLLHHTAFPQFLFITDNLELQFAGIHIVIIRSYQSGDSNGFTPQVIQHTTNGMSANPVFIGNSIHFERSPHHRLVDLRNSPVLNKAGVPVDFF